MSTGARELDDRVVVEQIVPCWDCRYCNTGNYHMCQVHNMYGFKRANPGGMEEFMILSTDSLVHKISKEIPPAHAAFAEPLSCALHAVERARITFADTVVVAGCGPIGLSMIAGAAAKFPQAIVALDMDPRKLDLALKTGATVAINIAEEDAVTRVKEMTGGYGCDVYLEGTGAPPAVLQGLNMLRKLGRVRRVLGLQGRRLRRLEHYQRRQGARRARCPPRPELLARRDPAHRVRPATDGRDLHASATALGVPAGTRPRGQRQGVHQGQPHPGRHGVSRLRLALEGTPAQRAAAMTMSRRDALKAAGVGALGLAAIPSLAACGVGGGVKHENGAAAVTGSFDWKKLSGSTVRVLQTPHPYQQSFQPLLAEFQDLTGITVQADLVPEGGLLHQAQHRAGRPGPGRTTSS